MAGRTEVKLMEAIVSLCKRRGFIYQSSEIYGGLNGFWDYGPLGVLLKNNIRDRWWRDMVLAPPVGPDGKDLRIVGLDCSIISHPRVWEASGHIGGFSDPMQTCRNCKKLLRADQVDEMLEGSEWLLALLAALPSDADEGVLQASAGAVRKWLGGKGRKVAAGLASDAARATAGLPDEGVGMKLLDFATALGAGQLPCPHCGGELTEPRQFNLMFQTHYGAVFDEEYKTWLRPETAQGMFFNFKNVLDTTRVKVPFGIAQLGKGFRNEITPKNYIFRSREFEMMEVEFFVHPAEASSWYEFWRNERYRWWCSLGLERSRLRLRDHAENELAHYSQDGGCCDVEYAFPFSGERGFSELEGVAYRSNYDLTQHAKTSGAKLDYFDPERNERYLPHVIEPAAGLTRGLLAVLCEAYTYDESRPSKEVMRFHPSLSPIKAAVFPLVNKDGLPEIAEKLYRDLRKRWPVETDAKQSIGKRYARMDEAGTPWCFTVDNDTLKDQAVTARDRDTGTQERIGIDRVVSFLAERLA